MATATVNGVELYYEVLGDGDPLVLTHGSWGDATGWEPALSGLAERYRLVVWDRRGHSRSGAGSGPGSRLEDAADLAGLIEHVVGGPAHLAGNSYGANVSLTVLAERPELVTTLAVHEPPLFALLDRQVDGALRDELTAVETELGVVRRLIGSGEDRAAAEHFVEHVALGPGMWRQLPERFRAVLTANAGTYLDELDDPTALSIDPGAVASTSAPLLVTHGTESPRLFRAVVSRLAALLPALEVEQIEGAGHLPHATHPDVWIDCLAEFHRRHAPGRKARRTSDPARGAV